MSYTQRSLDSLVKGVVATVVAATTLASPYLSRRAEAQGAVVPPGAAAAAAVPLTIYVPPVAAPVKSPLLRNVNREALRDARLGTSPWHVDFNASTGFRTLSLEQDGRSSGTETNTVTDPATQTSNRIDTTVGQKYTLHANGSGLRTFATNLDATQNVLNGWLPRFNLSFENYHVDSVRATLNVTADVAVAVNGTNVPDASQTVTQTVDGTGSYNVNNLALSLGAYQWTLRSTPPSGATVGPAFGTLNVGLGLRNRTERFYSTDFGGGSELNNRSYLVQVDGRYARVGSGAFSGFDLNAGLYGGLTQFTETSEATGQPKVERESPRGPIYGAHAGVRVHLFNDNLSVSLDTFVEHQPATTPDNPQQARRAQMSWGLGTDVCYEGLAPGMFNPYACLGFGFRNDRMSQDIAATKARQDTSSWIYVPAQLKIGTRFGPSYQNKAP